MSLNRLVFITLNVFQLPKDKRPMYYDARYWYAPGLESGTSSDCRFELGAKDWNLSAIDLAKLMVHMRYAETIFANYPDNPERIILSANNRQLMDEEMLGWHNKSENIFLARRIGACECEGTSNYSVQSL